MTFPDVRRREPQGFFLDTIDVEDIVQRLQKDNWQPHVVECAKQLRLDDDAHSTTDAEQMVPSGVRITRSEQ